MERNQPFGIAIYQCWSCKQTWTGKPGMQFSKKTNGACPYCGHEYCTWVNFDWWKERYKEHLISIKSPEAALW